MKAYYIYLFPGFSPFSFHSFLYLFWEFYLLSTFTQLINPCNEFSIDNPGLITQVNRRYSLKHRRRPSDLLIRVKLTNFYFFSILQLKWFPRSVSPRPDDLRLLGFKIPLRTSTISINFKLFQLFKFNFLRLFSWPL